MGIEFAVSIAAGVTFFGVLTSGAGTAIEDSLNGTRATLYGAAAASGASLLGFSIAAIAFALQYSNAPTLSVLRNSRHYPTFWKVFLAGNQAFALLTVLGFAALVLDTDTEPHSLVTALAFFSAILATLRTWRILWVLHFLVQIASKPAPGASPPGDGEMR